MPSPKIFSIDIRFSSGVRLSRKHLKGLRAITDEIEQEERKKRGGSAFLTWLLLRGHPGMKAYCREVRLRQSVVRMCGDRHGSAACPLLKREIKNA